jgi:hypothetical protein
MKKRLLGILYIVPAVIAFIVFWGTIFYNNRDIFIVFTVSIVIILITIIAIKGIKLLCSIPEK